MKKRLAIILAMVMCFGIVMTSCSKDETLSINFGDDFEKDTLSLSKLPWFSTVDDITEFLGVEPKLSVSENDGMTYCTVPMIYKELNQEGTMEFGLFELGEQNGFPKDEFQLSRITYAFTFDSKEKLDKFGEKFEENLKKIGDKNAAFKLFFKEDGSLNSNQINVEYKNDVVKDLNLKFNEFSNFRYIDLSVDTAGPAIAELREKYDTDYIFEWTFSVLGQ